MGSEMCIRDRLDAAGESVQLLYTGTAWAAVATSSFATNIATVIQ